MRKWVVLILVALLIPGSMSVTAAPVESLTSLAAFYEDDALFYVGIRTDENLLRDLDTLIARIAPFLPPQAQPETKLTTALEEALQEAGFSLDDIDAWLGDTAAIGMSSDFATLNSDNPPVAIALEVEGDAALDFFEALFEEDVVEGEFTIDTIGDFTVYVPESDSDPVFAFGDDVLFIGAMAAALPLEALPENPLLDNANFSDSVATLPAEEYTMLAYINTPVLNERVLQGFGNADIEAPPTLATLGNSAIGQVIGFTALDDGRSLVIDIAQVADNSVAEALGASIFVPQAADLSFLNRVPEDAALVIHGAEFGPSTQAGLDSFRALGDFIVDNGGLLSFFDPTGQLTGAADMDAQTLAFVNNIDIGFLTGGLNATFAGFTGLSLERDLLPVLDGDAVLYLRVRSVDDFFLLPALPDFGLVFETSDNAAAADIIDALVAASEAYDSNFPVETLGDGSALVLPLFSEASGFTYENLDLLVGADNGMLAFGTRLAVQRALETEGGLAEDATFTAASDYLLPGAQNLWYLNLQPVGILIEDLVAQEEVDASLELRQARRVLSLLDSASISSVVNEEGVGVVRFVLSLAEDPINLVAPDDQ